MKKKMLTAIIIIVPITIILFLAGRYVLLSRASATPGYPCAPESGGQISSASDGQSLSEQPSAQPADGIAADAQLYTLVDTEKKAKRIADQYGITLVSFANGVAKYHTDEDPADVIARGEKHGYPALSLNHIQQFQGGHHL